MADTPIEIPVASMTLAGFAPTHDIAVEVPFTGPGSIIDTNPLSLDNTNEVFSPGIFGYSQSITGDGKDIAEVDVKVRKIGTPAATCFVAIFAHSGTFGSTSIPTGTALATSDTRDPTTFSTSLSAETFIFSTPFTLVSGTKYCLVFWYEDAVVGDQIVGRAENTGSHAGNEASYNSASMSWGPQASRDMVFEIRSSPAGLTLEGFAPVLDLGIEVPTASLILTGFAPLALRNIVVEVPTGNLTLESFAPLAIINGGPTEVEVPTAGSSLVDSYAFVNNDLPARFTATTNEVGQSFTGDGKEIGSIVVELEKSGVPTGPIVLRIWEHTGTYGVTGTPTGSPLATSEVLLAEDLGVSFAEIHFKFLDPFQTVNGTNYFITIYYVDAVNGGSDFVRYTTDSTSPTHAGNFTEWKSGWLINTAEDMGFEVYAVAGMALRSFAPSAVLEGDAVIDPGLGVLTLTGFAPNLILTLFNVETCDMDVIFPKNVESLVIPTLQDIEFNLDRLKKLNLPDPVNVEIEPFTAFEPVAPTKEVERIQFLYTDFANTVQTIIDGKIGELTSEVKPYDVEYVEWGRNKEDLLDATEEAIETSFDGEAARGFVAPSGVFNKDLSKQSIRNKRNVSRANEQFFSEQNKSTAKNISDGLEAGNAAENIVRTTDQQRQTINLQAVMNLAEIDFRVFEVYLQRHNSRIEIKRIKHQAWIEELKGKLLILQERELAIKGHTLNLVERTQQVEMFNASIDYLNAQQAMKEIDLENFILEAEQEQNKLRKFQAEVDIFSSRINLNISKFNLYKAGIEFEESKVDQFQQEAAVAEAQLRVQSAKTNSGRVVSDTKLDVARAKLGAQIEKLRAARTRLETVLTEGRVKAVGFSSDLLVYQSDLRDWLNDVSNDVLELTAQAEDGKTRDVTFVRDETRILNEVVRSDTEAQNIKTLADLNAEVIATSADITAKTEITSKLVHTLAGG